MSKKNKKPHIHIFDVAFEVRTDKKDPDDVDMQEMMGGLLLRAAKLQADPDLEAFSHVDSFEEKDDVQS